MDTTARYRSKNERDKQACRERFDTADMTAALVVDELSRRREAKRQNLIAAGKDPTTVLAEKADAFRDGFLSHANPECTHGKTIAQRARNDPFRDQSDPFDEGADFDRLYFMPLLRAAIWELWRDYHEWPDGWTLIDRLGTWLGVDRISARNVVLGSRRDPWIGQHYAFEYPIFAEKPGNIRNQRWYFLDPEQMYFQEELYQWRKILGDDGLTFVVLLTMFADHSPDLWRLPA